jgi:hypothetical protein
MSLQNKINERKIFDLCELADTSINKKLRFNLDGQIWHKLISGLPALEVCLEETFYVTRKNL